MGTHCPTCRLDVTSGWRFCPDCGTPLTRGHDAGAQLKAPHTTTPSPISSKPADGPSEPERRQLTVMFCDLAGSTAMSRQLDPEDLREVIREYQTECSRVITRYQGSVARYTGDGILTHFGYPKAHEDDAERAVHASLEIVKVIDELHTKFGAKYGVALAVRVGIATGMVVAGDMIGEGPAEQQAVVGDTVNLAARLQHLAQPNTVIVADCTHQLLGARFEFEALGVHTLKGFSDPVRIWRVTRAIVTASRFDAMHEAILAPMVGRDEEINTLLHYWEQAKSGQGQVVLVSGEAGIGKSRVCRALRERLAHEPHALYRYQGSPHHTNSALYPFTTQIERTLRFERTESSDEKLDKLETLVAGKTDHVGHVVSLLASLLSVPSEHRYPPLDLTPQQLKEQTFATLVQTFHRFTEQQPVLMIVEDAHWIDASSLELLDQGIKLLNAGMILVVVTARPAFEPPWSNELHSKAITLDRLGRRHCIAICERVSHKLLPSTVIDQIVDKADGIPLFVEELTKSVLGSEATSPSGNNVMPNEDLPSFDIPASVHDSLTARLDRHAEVKEVAQTAAAIGREFSMELLVAVSDLNRRDLELALRKLSEAEIVFKNDLSSNYNFKHTLLRDAAYSGLLKSKRRALHLRIAKTMEELMPEIVATQPEVLAHHFTEANMVRPAIEYWERSGHRAVSRLANAEAVGHMSKGLKLLQRLPDTKDRSQRQIDFYIVLGVASRPIKGFASTEVERYFALARDLCSRVGTTNQSIDAEWGLYSCYYARGELGTARKQAERVIELGTASGDAGVTMAGHFMLGSIMFWQGEFSAARERLERAVRMYGEAAHTANLFAAQIEPGVNAMLHLSWALWILGYPDKARAISEQAISKARELHQPLTLALALFWACATRLCSGQGEAADPMLKELRSIANEQRYLFVGAITTIMESAALIQRGEFKSGLSHSGQGFAELQAQGVGLGKPWAICVPVVGYSNLGLSQNGLDTLSRAFEALEVGTEQQWKAEVYRLKGELLAMPPIADEAQAERCFRQALEISRSQHAKSLELRAAIDLARLLQKQGSKKMADAELRPVYEWFSEGFDTADLREAKNLLDGGQSLP